MPDDRVKVFLSYAREDEKSAARLAEDLRESGVEVWKDTISISPGEDWATAISTALRECSYVIVLLSEGSVVAGTYVMREIALALSLQREMAVSETYILPVRLTEVALPPAIKELRQLQTVDLFPDWDAGIRSISAALVPRPAAKKRRLLLHRWLGSLLVLLPVYGYLLVRELSSDSEFGIGFLLFWMIAPGVLLSGCAAGFSVAFGRSSNRLTAAGAGAVTAALMLVVILVAGDCGRP